MKNSDSKELKEVIPLPENVTAEVNGNLITIKGPKGSVTRHLKWRSRVAVEGKTIIITSNSLMDLNTAKAHLTNNLKGVQEPFSKHLKIVHAHFPITLETKGNKIYIKNFLGEKKPREAKIIGDVKIEVKGKDVFMRSCDIEALGQTYANIKSALKIRQRDSRVFQDGIYEIEE
ncbi:MAG: 50S ribosomal protein L6 [Candidatus Micrarchaeota archaeon]|nr:50S ribosomal protein L6 [Candidatus Micrarchaeota archaeon]